MATNSPNLTPPRSGVAGSDIQEQNRRILEQQRQRLELEGRQQYELSQLGFQKQKSEFGEYLAGAGQRAAERGFGEQQAMLGMEQARMGLRMLPLQEETQRKQAEVQKMGAAEYLGGAGLRGQQQELSGLQTTRNINRTGFESQFDPSSSDWFRESPEVTKLRQYQMGRESEDLDRLRMQEESQRLQSQMSFRPQMDAMRGGMMSRMAGRLGVQLPQMGGAGRGLGSGFPQQMGTMGGAGGPQPSQSFQGGGRGMMPSSWMQSYQSPQFPRY
jgi:hypothetical protein